MKKKTRKKTTSYIEKKESNFSFSRFDLVYSVSFITVFFFEFMVHFNGGIDLHPHPVHQ